MINAPVAGNRPVVAFAEPNSGRRAFLTSGAGAAIAAVVASTVPHAASDAADSQLVDMAAQIIAIRAKVNEIEAERVRPHDEEFDRLLGEVITPETLKIAWAFSEAVGREAGIKASGAFLNQADALIRRMWTIPAQTDAGRRAKVSTLFRHCLHGDDAWFETDRDADWHIEMTRQLLCELSGMTVEHLLDEMQS